MIKVNQIRLSVKSRIRIIRVQSRIVVGGPAKQTILLSKELNRNGYKTVLIGGASKSIEKSLIESAINNGIKCVVIPEMAREIHFYDDLISLVKLYKFIKKEKPVIFHSHTAKAGGIGRIAAYIAGVPLIFHTFHGHVFSSYFGKFKTKGFILIERLLARISTKIIVISESQRHDMIQKYRIGTDSRVELIRLGFNWNENFLKRSNVSLRNNFKISQNKFLVGIIGRLVSIKDHYLFIEVAEKLLLIEDNDYHFVIIGDGELKFNLIDLVKSKNIEKHFTFTGWIEINKSIYEELNLLLLTSKNEGTPVTIIEALASGIPVIASNVGGVRDVMKLYNTAFLIRERDPLKYCEKILKLRENSNSPSKETQAKVMQTYDSERLVLDIKNLYKKSVEKLNQSFVSLDK